MKRFEIQSFGPGGLALTEQAQPEPAPGQVLVRVHAFSLNYRDLLLVNGLYNPRLRLPFVPLSDCAGEVVGVGSGVTRFKPGDRVAGIFMQSWLEGEVDEDKARSALGGAIEGVAADYKLFPETGLVKIPDYLTDEEAATLPCAAVTAWNSLFETGSVKPGDTVLALGTGGVSIFALQFATLAGARVVITSSSDEKLSRTRELGASETINYATNPDWDKHAREWAGGKGVDQVIEVGGPGTLPKSIKAVRSAGTISLIGMLAQGSDINPTPILMRSLRVQGIFVGSRRMFENMLSAMTKPQLRPVIDRVFSFDQLPEALEYMRSGKHFGKICVRVR